MADHERRDRPHTAVYWEFLSLDKHAQPRVRPPVEVRVMWDTRRTRGRDAQGNTIALDAAVDVGPLNVKIGSLMWLGELADFLGTGSGDDASEIHEVVTVEQENDIKGRHTARSAGLKRWRGDPATLG